MLVASYSQSHQSHNSIEFSGTVSDNDDPGWNLLYSVVLWEFREMVHLWVQLWVHNLGKMLLL